MGLALSFFLVIITATVCWLLCTIYIQLLANHYSKKIAKSSSASDSCRYRCEYKHSLLFEKIIFAILALIGTMCIFEFVTHDLLHHNTPGKVSEYFSSPIFWIIYSIIYVYYIVLMLTNTSYSPFETVTSMTKEKIKKNYVLFLRGFGTDNYLSVNYQEKNKEKETFSEHHFMRRLSLMCETYAVGRPEELKSPSGATRVYLDNSSWQSDVKDLMHNAKCVIILVSDKPNCVWEIIQSLGIQSKVVYIVNNKSRFINVCHQLPDFNPSGSIPDDERFYLYTDNNGKLVSKPFKNTGSGYWNIINVVRKISQKYNEKRWLK